MEPASLTSNANKVATPISPEMGKIKSPEEELAFLRGQLEVKNKEIEEFKTKSILLPGATEVSVIIEGGNLPANETVGNKNVDNDNHAIAQVAQVKEGVLEGALGGTQEGVQGGVKEVAKESVQIDRQEVAQGSVQEGGRGIASK